MAVAASWDRAHSLGLDSWRSGHKVLGDSPQTGQPFRNRDTWRGSGSPWPARRAIALGEQPPHLLAEPSSSSTANADHGNWRLMSSSYSSCTSERRPGTASAPTALPPTGSGPLSSAPAPEEIGQWAPECACGNLFMEDSRFCRRCGAKRVLHVAADTPASTPAAVAWAEPASSAGALATNSGAFGITASSSACSDSATSAGLIVATQQHVDTLEQRFAATVSQLQKQQTAEKDATLRIAEQSVGKLEARISLAETQQLRVERRAAELASLVKDVGDEQQATTRRFERLQEHVRSLDATIGQVDEKWQRKSTELEQDHKALAAATQSATSADEDAQRHNAHRLGQLELQVEELRSAEISMRQMATKQNNGPEVSTALDASLHTSVIAERSASSSGVSVAVKAVMQELESSLQSGLHHVQERCDAMQERVENQVGRALCDVEQKLKDHDMKVDQLIGDGQESAARVEEQEVRLSVFRSKLDAYDQRLVLFSDRVDRALLAADSDRDRVSDITAPFVAAVAQAPFAQHGGGSDEQLEHRLNECERALESMRTEFAERSMELAVRAQAGFAELRSTLGSVVVQVGQQRDRDVGLHAATTESSKPQAAHPADEELYERLRDLEARADEQEALAGALRKGLPVIQKSLAEVRSALDGAIVKRQANCQEQSGQMQTLTDTDGKQETAACAPGEACEMATASDDALAAMAAIHRRFDEMVLRVGSLPSRIAIIEERLDHVASPADVPSVAKREDDVVATKRRLQEMEAAQHDLTKEIQKMTKINTEREGLRTVAPAGGLSTISDVNLALRIEKTERELDEIQHAISDRQHEHDRFLREFDQSKLVRAESAIEELGEAISRQQQEQNRLLRELDHGKVARVEAAIEELGGAISRQHEQERILRELDQDKVARAEAAIEELGGAISCQRQEREHILREFDPNRIARAESAIEELGDAIARQQAELAYIAEIFEKRMDADRRSGIGRHAFVAPTSAFLTLRNLSTEASDQAAGGGSDGGPLSERGAEAAGGHGSTTSHSSATAQGRCEGAEAGGGGPAPSIASSSHGLLQQHGESAEAGDDSGGPTSNSASSTPATSSTRGGLVTASAQGGASAGEEAAGGGPSSRPANGNLISAMRPFSRVPVTSNIVGAAGEDSARLASLANAMSTGGGPETSAGMPRRGDAEDGGGPSRGLAATALAAEGDGAAGGAAGRQQQPPFPQWFSRSGGLSDEADDGGGGGNADRHHHRAGSTLPTLHSNAGNSGSFLTPFPEGDGGGRDGDGGGGVEFVGAAFGSSALGASSSWDALLTRMAPNSAHWDTSEPARGDVKSVDEGLLAAVTADGTTAVSVSQPFTVSGLLSQASESVDVAASSVLDSVGVCAADALEPLIPPRNSAMNGKAVAALTPPAAPTSHETVAPPQAGAPGSVRHVFFDFDQTVSRIHVFKQLAGWERGVPAPHSLSERGQIHKMASLNSSGRWAYDSKSGLVVQIPSDTDGGGRWTNACLGGPDRVNELHVMLVYIRNSGAKSTIITRGNIGAVRYILAQESLLDFFHDVFGMLGNFYGETEFDRVNAQPSPYEGTPPNELQGTKAQLIVALMAAEKLQEAEAALVEDDKAEIDTVSGICRSMFVSERRGMNVQHMAALQAYIASDCSRIGSIVPELTEPISQEFSLPEKAAEPHASDGRTTATPASAVMSMHVHDEGVGASRATEDDAGEATVPIADALPIVSLAEELGITVAEAVAAPPRRGDSSPASTSRSNSSDGFLDLPDLTINSGRISVEGSRAAAAAANVTAEIVSGRSNEVFAIAGARGKSSSSESETASANPKRGFAGWDSVFGDGSGAGISIGLCNPSSSIVAEKRGADQVHSSVSASAPRTLSAGDDDDEDDEDDDDDDDDDDDEDDDDGDNDPLANLGIIDSDDASESSSQNSNRRIARQDVCGNSRGSSSLADVVLPMVTSSGKRFGGDDGSDVESIGAESSSADLPAASRRIGFAATGPTQLEGKTSGIQVERRFVAEDSNEADFDGDGVSSIE